MESLPEVDEQYAANFKKLLEQKAKEWMKPATEAQAYGSDCKDGKCEN